MFERLLMDDPGNCVISTKLVRPQPKDASLAGESEVLRYLYMCYERLKHVETNKQVGFSGLLLVLLGALKHQGLSCEYS